MKPYSLEHWLVAAGRPGGPGRGSLAGLPRPGAPVPKETPGTAAVRDAVRVAGTDGFDGPIPVPRH